MMYFMCIIMVQLGAVGNISILEMRTRSIQYIASGHFGNNIFLYLKLSHLTVWIMFYFFLTMLHML